MAASAIPPSNSHASNHLVRCCWRDAGCAGIFRQEQMKRKTDLTGRWPARGSGDSVPGWEKSVPFAEKSIEAEDGSRFGGRAKAEYIDVTCLSRLIETVCVERLRWPQRLAALQATGFMARRNEPTEGAHALGGEITVVWFHPKPLPQRRRHVGNPASDAAKKGMRKGCHGQTSGLSDRCLSGQNGILREVSARKIMLNAQARLAFAFSYPGNSEDDRSRPAVLSKIARFLWESKRRTATRE